MELDDRRIIISPKKMAGIYWSRLQGRSVLEVEIMLKHMSQTGKAFWTKVLSLLQERKEQRNLH
jgi:hypothetical protein